jgi:branched-subunit amino acid ABC-type transport system permease component
MSESILASGTRVLLDVLIASAMLFILTFGLFLIYGLFRIVNMAHGDLVTAGAYSAALSQGRGLNFWLCVLVAAVVTATIALLIDVSCVGRLRHRSPLATMLATWGFSLMLTQGILLAFGPAGRYVDPPIVGQVEIFGSIYSSYQLILLLVAVVLLLGTWSFLKRSNVGLRIRACIDDAGLAQLQGVDTSRLFSTVFALGGAFAGIAGAMLAPFSAVNPNAGSAFSVSAFMVLITGGLGDVFSSAAGALVVGGARSVLGTFFTITLATLGTLALVAVILAIRRTDADLD